MSDTLPSKEVLQSHLKLLSELHDLFLEESALLRASGLPPDEAFLERKKGYLSRLDDSLGQLKALGGAEARLGPDDRSRVKDARNRLLQILMLDRENERMLLKKQLSPQVRQRYAPVLPGRIAQAYGTSPDSAGKPPA
jgi:hypothetical protein